MRRSRPINRRWIAAFQSPEEVHLNRGVIYSDCLRQDDAAERELQAALALDPNYVPALLNLANLREDFGKQAEAGALYEKILALQPRCYIALARYAGLQKVVRPDDPLIARLRGAIADPAASAAERADLGFALGKMLDSCSAWGAAFAAYTAANRDSRQNAGRIAVYDRRAHEAFIDALIAEFQPGQTTAARLPQSARPVFICGMFRSGSTLTEQILSAHSRVARRRARILPSMIARDGTVSKADDPVTRLRSMHWPRAICRCSQACSRTAIA